MLELAEHAVSIANKTLNEFDLSKIEKWAKHGNPRDLVSEVDQAIEERVKEFLTRETPQIPVVGEEFSPDFEHQNKSAWILDPIDGTANFLQGLDHFSISLALINNSTPEVGVILNPTQNLLYKAQKNHGAYLNGSRIEADSPKDLTDSFLCLEWGRSNQSIETGMELMRIFVPRVREYRNYGGAAQTICHVAESKLDIYIDHGLKIWDYAAGWCILNESGGMLEPISINGNEVIIAGGNDSLISAAKHLIKEEISY